MDRSDPETVFGEDKEPGASKTKSHEVVEVSWREL